MTKLSKEALKNTIKTSVIGSKMHFYTELTSTFDQIREFEISEGLTVVCQRQTAGSGRLGRKWESQEGGIYFTFSLVPPFGGFDVPFLTIVCAIGVCRALSRYIPCTVKWPNDIVSDGRKLCGILTKTLSSDGNINAVLVGIGINVNNSFDEESLPYASSLMTITGKAYDENKIFAEVLGEIEKVYLTMSHDEILISYKDMCINLGKEVTLTAPNGETKGLCTDILPDGSMNVKTRSGMINVHSGEVSVKGIYQKKQEGNIKE